MVIYEVGKEMKGMKKEMNMFMDKVSISCAQKKYM